MLLNTSKSKDGRRRNFFVGSLDSSQNVISSVIDAFDDLMEERGGQSWGVGGRKIKYEAPLSTQMKPFSLTSA
jgi:hypothetical protein